MDKNLSVRQDLIRALISILSHGVQEGELDDAETLLSAVKILSPELKGIDEFSAYIAIKRGQVREAMQMYASAPSDDSKWFVMMALCLKLSGDPTWHWHATQSLEKTDASSKYSHDLARILLDQDAPEAPAKEDENDSAKSQVSSPSLESYASYLSV